VCVHAQWGPFHPNTSKVRFIFPRSSTLSAAPGVVTCAVRLKAALRRLDMRNADDFDEVEYRSASQAVRQQTHAIVQVRAHSLPCACAHQLCMCAHAVPCESSTSIPALFFFTLTDLGRVSCTQRKCRTALIKAPPCCSAGTAAECQMHQTPTSFRILLVKGLLHVYTTFKQEGGGWVCASPACWLQALSAHAVVVRSHSCSLTCPLTALLCAAVHHGWLELPLGPACLPIPGADAVFALRWACCLECHGIRLYALCCSQPAQHRQTAHARLNSYTHNCGGRLHHIHAGWNDWQGVCACTP
jgi:hypothetical protein